MQSEAKLQPTTEFGGESDYDLIEYMALAEEDQAGASLAWAEFYHRHFGYVLGVLKRGYSGSLDEDSIEGLAKDTVIRAFEKAKSFKPSEDQEFNAQRRHVRGWLGRIAVRILISQFRKDQRLKLVYPDKIDTSENDGWGEIFREVADKAAQSVGNRDNLWGHKKEWVREAYKAILNDKEREVLRVTIEFDQPGQAHQRLPDGISQKLADAIGSTPAGIRQIRLRAKKKIRDYVNQRIKEQGDNKK